MSQAPKQLPSVKSPDFDPKMMEFYRACYQIWQSLNQGNFAITPKTPTASTPGAVGEMAIDDTYLYIYRPAGTWRKIAHSAL